MASSALDLLVCCAQAMRDGNLKDADSLLERIWKLADDESDEIQSEVVRYFAEALVRRAYGLNSADPDDTLHLPPFLSVFQPFDSTKIPFDSTAIVTDAIDTAAMGKKQLHIIAFDNSCFLRIRAFLSNSSPALGGSMSVRVSLILPTISEKTNSVQERKRNFNELAKQLKQENLKIVYASSLGEVDASTLDFRRTKDEAVVICYWFQLHELLAETGALEREFSKLRDINPESVIIAEEDADLNNSDFIKRLEDSFQYYSNASRGERFDFVKNGYRRQIHNIVGCEGRDRIVRRQTLVQWQSLLQSAGFLPFPLEVAEQIQKNKEFWDDSNSNIHEHNGSALFALEDRPHFSISAWKLTAKESHFNPTNNNFVEGFDVDNIHENVGE